MHNVQNKRIDNKRIDNSSDNKNNRADKMIEEFAVVKRIGQGYAEVIAQGSSCSSCSSQSGCASTTGSTSSLSTSLLRLFSWKKTASNSIQTTLRVQNPVYAQPGDKVVVGIRTNTVLKSSLLAYFSPLVLMLILAAIGSHLFAAIGMNSEVGSILMGLFGLFSGFKLVAYWVNHSLHSMDYEATILRIVELETHSLPFYSSS